MRSFTYEFEELPLVISKDGIHAALVNGCVEVEYDADGVFGYEDGSVCVEGYQTLTAEQRAAGKKPWVYVKAPSDIADIIIDRLNDEWRDRVNSALADERIAAAADCSDYEYDRRRDDAMNP